MTLYWIETQSISRIYYCVDSEEPISNNQIQEMIEEGMTDCGQEWLGEKVIGVREINHSEYIKNYNEANPDLAAMTEADKDLYIISRDEPKIEEFINDID